MHTDTVRHWFQLESLVLSALVIATTNHLLTPQDTPFNILQCSGASQRSSYATLVHDCIIPLLIAIFRNRPNHTAVNQTANSSASACTQTTGTAELID